MAEVVLFHHAMGQTAGFHDFAQQLRDAGHTIHTPDLFEGRTFSSIEDGLAFVEELGFPDQLVERADHAVASLPDEVVYAGFSVGVVSAQRLAQTRPGAKGALLFYSCIPLEFFGGSWPSGVPVEIHAMDADPFFVDEGDLEAAGQLVASTDQAELFLYPGDQHYFADSSLPSYRPEAASLLLERVKAFLYEV
jgi:dienelactone hydrolase